MRCLWTYVQKMRNNEKIKDTYLGLEIGSTRIKAVTVDSESLSPISGGSFSWKSDFINGVWTYDLDKAWEGINEALSQINDPDSIKAVGISGMMHGYLAFDDDWNLLTPFRTWQNTMTARSAKELTELFNFNIPQRWSSAHLYEAVLSNEPHVNRVAHITTIAGYIHYMLTGVNAVGIGEASGIFPIDPEKLGYDEKMLEKFNAKLLEHGFSKRAEDVFPKVLTAGESAGCLTEKGAEILGGIIKIGTPFAPPEGDAGTGMVATNSISYKTGNISAGTSIFAMVVLEKHLSKIYEEIDMVATPDGKPVAMVHCNNCTNDINAWVSLFREMLALFGKNVSDDELYTKLYETSLMGEGDCGGVLVCNYLAGEVLAGLDKGIPMLLRRPDAKFSLANVMRSHIYGALATLKLGMEIFNREKVEIERFTAHGGLFKTPGVAQRYMAAACNTDIVCLETSGEGGPYGMALLAAFMNERVKYSSLDTFLRDRVFANADSITLSPIKTEVEAFSKYIANYKQMLEVERKAVEST